MASEIHFARCPDRRPRRATERLAGSPQGQPLQHHPLLVAKRRPPQGAPDLYVVRGLDSLQAAITSDLCVRPQFLRPVHVTRCPCDSPSLRGNR